MDSWHKCRGRETQVARSIIDILLLFLGKLIEQVRLVAFLTAIFVTIDAVLIIILLVLFVEVICILIHVKALVDRERILIKLHWLLLIKVLLIVVYPFFDIIIFIFTASKWLALEL